MRRSNQWSSEVTRGNHTLRAVASTIGTSLRRRASKAVPARIERLASALTNSACSYCESGRARAIRGHQRQLTNSACSYCESGRARAIRGNQRQLTNSACSYCESGRARAIRGHQRQSRVGLVLSEVVMGDQSQSGSVRGNQRTLICNHVATRGNQRQSDVHSDAIERESYEIRCNQEAIRGHQRPSEQLTCQSGSASSPPSSSSPASTAASPGRSLRSSSRSRSPMVVPDSLSRWSAGE